MYLILELSLTTPVCISLTRVSFSLTTCPSFGPPCERFKTCKFEELELGWSNKKITNIIDDQGPKTYL